MQAEGKGELGPTAEEIKANVARAAGTGLDSGVFASQRRENTC